VEKKLKIFIIAGEVSGDVLGAKIMHEIGGRAEFIGIGGDNMKSAGLRSLFPISDLAVMGIFDVLARARTLTRRIDETVAAIVAAKPDIVLTIDSPGFAKRVVKKVRAAGGHVPRFYHVVAPQVWAWGPWRAKKIAKIFDRLYAFFDFEVPYFTKYGLNTIAVGHPIADGLQPSSKKPIVKSPKSIALIPGSRISEVKKLLPVFRTIVDELGPNYKYYIPVVETTEQYIREQTAHWTIKPERIAASARYKLFEKTDIAIAASGTVSAELAIMHVPAIIVYKVGPVTEMLGRILIKTKWASLVNILLGKTVYPEILGRTVTPDNIIREFRKLEPIAARKKMISELARADKLWYHGKKSPAKIIADDLVKAYK